MGPGLNLDDAKLSPDNQVLHPNFLHANRPIRSRQSTPPRSGSSRNAFSPSSTPAHSPPQAVSEDEEKKEEDEEKKEEDEESAQEESRPRLPAFSEDGSLMSLDDTFETHRYPPVENKPDDDLRATFSYRRQHLFGFALPRWWTSRPSKREISSWIVKHAPCFWCTRASGLTMTSRDIVLRLFSLCAVCGLAQVASASYILIVLLSTTIVNRDAQNVVGNVSVINLWDINYMVLCSGVIGLLVALVMIFSRRAIAEVHVGGSLRFMWFLLWLIPLEIFVTVNLFDYHRVSEVKRES
jgi:hypothetical protein